MEQEKRVDEQRTVYITKYALTKGILEERALIFSNSDGKMIRFKAGGYDTYYHTPDWHPTMEQAVTHAEWMRARKIASLEKSLKKMEALKF